MQREQKTEESGCPAEGRLEAEGTQGAQSIEVRKTANEDDASGRKPEGSLLDAIVSVSNMCEAQERVIANRGVSGNRWYDGRGAQRLPYQTLSGTLRKYT